MSEIYLQEQDAQSRFCQFVVQTLVVFLVVMMSRYHPLAPKLVGLPNYSTPTADEASCWVQAHYYLYSRCGTHPTPTQATPHCLAAWHLHDCDGDGAVGQDVYTRNNRIFFDGHMPGRGSESHILSWTPCTRRTHVLTAVSPRAELWDVACRSARCRIML